MLLKWFFEAMIERLWTSQERLLNPVWGKEMDSLASRNVESEAYYRILDTLPAPLSFPRTLAPSAENSM